MTWELWEKDGGQEKTFIPQNHPQHEWLTKGSTKVWEVEASSDDEAYTLRNEHLGWAPYKPMS